MIRRTPDFRGFGPCSLHPSGWLDILSLGFSAPLVVRAPARVKDFPRGAQLPVFLLDPPEPLAVWGAMKPRDRIGEFIEELVVEALRQLFGYTKPRSGKLGLTLHGFQKMQEQGLDVATLEDAFRFGVEVREKMIIREYANYTVGLTYDWNETGTGFLIITCWKRGGEKRYVRF